MTASRAGKGLRKVATSQGKRDNRKRGSLKGQLGFARAKLSPILSPTQEKQKARVASESQTLNYLPPLRPTGFEEHSGKGGDSEGGAARYEETSMREKRDPGEPEGSKKPTKV